MKTFKIFFAIAIIGLLFTIDSNAQARQAYTVHVDRVHPAMIGTYEAISKELIAESKKHGSDYGWLALVTDEFEYYYVSPIANMAALDGNPFASLGKKMGEGALENLFDRMDKCYDDHVNYVISLDNELSYMPSGMTQTPAGQPFRKNTLYYVAPENYKAAVALAKEFKALYAKKGSKVHYRVYRSGYGTDGTYFMVAVAAKNAAEYEQMRADNMTLLGKEGEALAGRLMGLISKTKSVTGSIRTDLSYAPKK